MSSVMEISEILDRINRVTGRFEREAVEAAIVRQDEITPELLQILEKLLRALEALECLVRSGRVERAVVVLYFRELFDGKLERTRSDLWDCLAGLAVELEAAELLPEIRRAYEDGLLSPEMNIEEIEEYLYEADWEGFGSLISHAFSGAHRPALDLMTGKGWWTRSDREPRRSAKRKRDSA